MKELRAFIDGLPRERVGLVLDDGEVVELPNISSEPEDSFFVSATDMLPYLDRVRATWHTHPMGGLEPSSMDMVFFRSWPDLTHWIVAQEGERSFVVRNGQVEVVE